MKRLKPLREEKGLKQKDLAELLGITRAAYTNIENGKRETDFTTLKKLASVFNVSTDYLLGNTNDPTPPDAKKDPLDDLKFALWGHGDISDAALDDVRRYAQFIEQREKEQENGKLK